MNITIETDEKLFEGGPFPHLQRSLGLFRPVGVSTSKRAALVLVLGWVIPVLLVVLENLALRDNASSSFFRDFAVHARSLIAAPLFILAEAVCLPRLEKIARHFLVGGLVRDEDGARFKMAVTTTRRLINSTLTEISAILLAYAAIAALLYYVPPSIVPAWYSWEGRGYPSLSPAGWWYAFVSIPLLLILFFGWLWRVFLWGRFLWLMSRLDLRLIPSHPDHAGGLEFIGSSQLAFMPLGFTLGVIAAGTVANHVVYDGASPADYKGRIAWLLASVLSLFVGPMLVFILNLRRTKLRGILEYGHLAHDVGLQFEKKWLNRTEQVDSEALDVQDFSATTDLYQVVSNVHEMKSLPFDYKQIGGLIVATLLPFVPVALMAVPLKVVLEEIAKLLL